MKRSLREMALVAIWMTVGVVLVFGSIGIVGAVSPAIIPDIYLLFIIGALLLAAYRGRRGAPLAPIAVGVALPVIGVSILGTVTLSQHAPSLHHALVRGTVESGVVVFLVGLIGAFAGRWIASKWPTRTGVGD